MHAPTYAYIAFYLHKLVWVIALLKGWIPMVFLGKIDGKTYHKIFFFSSEEFLAAITVWGVVSFWYQLQ